MARALYTISFSMGIMEMLPLPPPPLPIILQLKEMWLFCPGKVKYKAVLALCSVASLMKKTI